MKNGKRYLRAASPSLSKEKKVDLTQSWNITIFGLKINIFQKDSSSSAMKISEQILIVELLRVLEFLGLSEVPAEVIQDAIDYASFDNMRKMEVEGKFQNSILKPADINNSDSFKTRKGKVKGYLDNLTEKEIADLSHILKSKLSKTYGYSD